MPTTTKEQTVDRLIVIDDDKELCDLVTEYLRPEGFDVDAVHNAAQGVERAISGKYNVVILDVMLPGMNGFDVLRRVRAQSAVPVLMLTARGDDVDRIVGLEIGADDYLPKPFNPRELLARIRAILRRTAASRSTWTLNASSNIEVGDVVMNLGTRTVCRAGSPVQLTSVEFAVLEILLRSAGSLVTREELSRRVLDRDLSPYDRSVDVHISNLRKKLGHRIGSIERIKTIRSAGYVYSATSSNPPPDGQTTHPPLE